MRKTRARFKILQIKKEILLPLVRELIEVWKLTNKIH
jgi:hypothetical protein